MGICFFEGEQDRGRQGFGIRGRNQLAVLARYYDFRIAARRCVAYYRYVEKQSLDDSQRQTLPKGRAHEEVNCAQKVGRIFSEATQLKLVRQA